MTKSIWCRRRWYPAARPADQTILAALLTGARADPDGFRLLFTHAAREPEFSAEVAAFEAHMRTMAREQVADLVDPEWLDWTAALVPTVTTVAIVAWVEAGMPDPTTALQRISAVVHAVIAAPARVGEG